MPSKDRFIFLRADRAVPYGELMDVLEILRAGGYSKIKLVALEGVPEPRRRLRHRQTCEALSGGPIEMSDLDTRTKTFPAAVDSRRRWPRSRCISAARRWRSRICAATMSTNPSARRRSRSAWN